MTIHSQRAIGHLQMADSPLLGGQQEISVHTPPAFFTRQQVAALVGVTDEVIGFWIKKSLIVAAAGGGGRGSHRKFDVFQVNIAAVLANLRTLGVNVGMLGQIAELLQRGAALGGSADCNFFGISNAIDVFHSLDRFRRGEPILVDDDPSTFWQHHPGFDSPRAAGMYAKQRERPARTEDEVLAHLLKDHDDLHDDAGPILAFARRLTEADILPLEMFTDLNEGFYRFVWDGHIMTHGWQDWVIGTEADGSLRVFRAPPAHDQLGIEGQGLRIGIFLSTGAIFRSVWGEIERPILVNEPPRSEEFLQRRVESIAAHRRETGRIR